MSYFKKYGEPRLNVRQTIYVNNQIARLSFLCLVFSSLHFCVMNLIKEFSLASRFYLSQLKFASQNLRNALQIAKCPVLLWVTKKMTRKTNLIVYYTFSVSISLILYNNWDRSFENYNFMLTKFDHYFV